MTDPKADLHDYLQQAREDVLWKLEGLSEYDVRRPLTPTGTNLLGLVKHLSSVELLYFGFAFDRHFPDPPAWFRHDAPPNTDMWATADESREHIVDAYRRACAHSDATIEALGLDTVGFVPWWPEDHRKTTLHRALAHVIAEAHRHTGHADIVRELVDGAIGQSDGNEYLPFSDQAWWAEHRRVVEQAAQEAGQR
jgi:uncharacterized damage-inducible protein DinB